MPRPLIVKVVDHKPNPQKAATGSIDIQLLKETNKASLYGVYNQDAVDLVSVTEKEQVTNFIEETGTRSLVRSLISRYETSRTKSTLIKHKSKSLSDLAKPQGSVSRRTVQDDSSNNRYSFGESGDQPFDFRKVLSKFETSSQPGTKSLPVATKTRSYTNVDINGDLSNFTDIKQSVKALLQTFEECRYDSTALVSWQDQVIEFLQKINNLSGQASINQNAHEQKLGGGNKIGKNIYPVTDAEENFLKRAKSLESGELSKSPKVKDIKSVFETNVGDKKSFSRSVSAFSTYFTGKPTDNSVEFPKQVYNKQNSALPLYNTFSNNLKSKENYGSGNDSFQQGIFERNRITANPVMTSTKKIQELKGFFESNTDDKYVPYEEYVVENGEQEDEDSSSERIDAIEERMLPPAKVITLDDDEDRGDDIETSKQQIEELITEIEEYDDKIESISKEDEEEGSYINEVLIRLLIKLDDVKTYGDGVIQMERRKAIQFVQNCITKLRGKIRG